MSMQKKTNMWMACVATATTKCPRLYLKTTLNTGASAANGSHREKHLMQSYDYHTWYSSPYTLIQHPQRAIAFSSKGCWTSYQASNQPIFFLCSQHRSTLVSSVDLQEMVQWYYDSEECNQWTGKYIGVIPTQVRCSSSIKWIDQM